MCHVSLNIYLLQSIKNNYCGNIEIMIFDLYITEMLLYGNGKYHSVDNDMQNNNYFGTNSNNSYV